MFKFFGAEPALTRHMGQVFRDQLLTPSGGHRVLERISPKCENCGNSEFYNLYETYRVFRLFGIPLGKCDATCYFSCPECNDGFKLSPEEYETLVQLAQNNTKYMAGKITKAEFESNLRKLQA